MGRLNNIATLLPQVPPCPHWVAQAVRETSAAQRAAGFAPTTSPLDGQIPPYGVRRRETWLLELLDLVGGPQIRIKPVAASGWDDELDLSTIAALLAEPLASIDAREQLRCREFATDRLCQARVYCNPRSWRSVTTYYDYSTSLFFTADEQPFASRAALEAAHGFDASWRWSSYYLYADYGRMFSFRSPARTPVVWGAERAYATSAVPSGAGQSQQRQHPGVRIFPDLLTLLGYQSRQRLRGLLVGAIRQGMKIESCDMVTMKTAKWPRDSYAFEWHPSQSCPGRIDVCQVRDGREVCAVVLDFRSQQDLVDYVFATLDIADALTKRGERRIVVRVPARIGPHWIVRRPVEPALCQLRSYDRDRVRVGAFLDALAKDYTHMTDPALRIVEECIRLARAEYDGHYGNPRTANGILDNVAIRWEGGTGQYEFIIYNPM